MRGGLVALAVVASVSVAAVWAAGSVLIAPAQRPVAVPPDLTVERLSIPSATPPGTAPASGTLAGWALPADSARGVVVLMHGVRADRASQTDRMRLFHGAGYHVVAFDFQAHGESPGDAITFGARERHDAVAAVQVARQRFPSLPVAVVGQSMGGAAAILAGPDLDADALVVESVYASIERATQNRLGMQLGAFGRALTPLLTAQLSVRLAVDAGDLQPARAAAALDVPILVMGGTEDRHAQPDEVHAIYDAAPAPRALWMVPGAAHQDLYRFAPDAYRQRVLGFLDRHLPSAPPTATASG